jgi:hypothetical protein
MNVPLSRRDVVNSLTLLAAGVVLAARAARADDEKLSVTDPAAVALGYVEDAAHVDAKKFPDYAPGSDCENCLKLEGKSGQTYRPCSLFPGKLVAAKGWCSGWTAEM